VEQKSGVESGELRRGSSAAKAPHTPDFLEQIYGEEMLWVMSVNSPWYHPLRNKGCAVETPCRFPSLPGKILRAVFIRGNLPLQSFFYHPRVRENTSRLIILVVGYLTTKSYLRWVRKTHPDARLVLLYEDPVQGYVIRPDQIPDCGYEVWTFDPADAERFGIRFVKGLYITEGGQKSETPVYDVCFFGKDKGRAEAILSLRDQLRELGLKPMFQIMPDTKFQMRRKSFYQPYIPFSHIRETMLQSRAQLDFLQQGQSGISLRTLECMHYGVKLVTNNPAIERYDIYHPDSVFLLEKRPLTELASFLNTPFVRPAPAVWEQYTIEYWMTSLRNQKQQPCDREEGEPLGQTADRL
jgi:hypothetical protein